MPINLEAIKRANTALDQLAVAISKLSKLRDNLNNSQNEQVKKGIEAAITTAKIKIEDLKVYIKANNLDKLEVPGNLAEEIERNFYALEEKHHFFRKEEMDAQKTLYKELYWFVNKVDGKCIPESIYKMLILFGGVGIYDYKKIINTFIEYCRRHKESLKDSNDIIHDAFESLTLPTKGQSVTLEWWRENIRKSGLTVERLFSRADAIEEKKANLDGGHLCPASIEEAKLINICLAYSLGYKNEELAVLCKEYNQPEKVFNQCLELDKKRKAEDNLPNIIIDGAEITGGTSEDRSYSGYWLVKLPINDPRAYLLGHITNCCQSIGGDSERCVIDGVTRKNNGFYILLKAKKNKLATPFLGGKANINYAELKIIGQGYAWLSEAGNLVFDSWENLDKTGPSAPDNLAAQALLQNFAKQVSETQGFNISRVIIGAGGGTRKIFAHKEVVADDCTDKMLEGYSYGDASKQYILYESKKLLASRRSIEKIAINLPVGRIIKSIDETKQCMSIKEQFKSLFNEKQEPLNEDAGKAIVSLSQHYVYLTSKIGLDNLKDLGAEKIVALTSWDAIVAYEAGATFVDLKGLSAKEIAVLTSWNARAAYEAGATFADLKNLNAKEFAALTSDGAIAAYEAGAKFVELMKSLSDGKIAALTSWNARAAYEVGIMFVDLKDFDAKKIIALTSGNIVAVCKAGIKFTDLKELGAEKIAALTSGSAIAAYETGITFANLKDLSAEKITALTSWHAREVYGVGIKFADLKDLDAEKIAVLTSWNAMAAYEAGVTLADLKVFDYNKIAVLTSMGAMTVCKTGVAFVELKDLNIEKIAVLTSRNAIAVYEAWATFAELKDLNIEKIAALTSDGAIAVYEHGTTFAELKNLSVKEIAALTSMGAILAYQAGATFTDLKDCLSLDTEQFVALTSESAITAYEAGVTFVDFKSYAGLRVCK